LCTNNIKSHQKQWRVHKFQRRTYAASTSRTHFVHFAAFTDYGIDDLESRLEVILRSLIFVPIKSAYMTSYWSSVVTLVLSCRVSEILELLYAESRFFDTSSLFRQKFQGVALGVDCGERTSCRLTNREIIFEDFQPTV